MQSKQDKLRMEQAILIAELARQEKRDPTSKIFKQRKAAKAAKKARKKNRR